MKLSVAVLMVILLNFSHAEEYNILVNADFTYNKASSESIYKGISTALSEVDFKINENKVTLQKCDHRGVNSRSDQCVRKYLSDPKALVMYTGLHSPPLISNIKKKNSGYNINEKEVFTLDPWAAAGIITRGGIPNWIYRLSIDDKYAGRFILNQTLNEGYKKISLLLVDDGWGQYNRKMITAEMAKRNLSPVSVTMFSRDVSYDIAQIHLTEIKKSKADAIILVANAPQGVEILKAFKALKLEKKIAVRSHWGITGGNLWEKCGDFIKNIDLKVIQTHFAFTNKKISKFNKNVFLKAQKLFPELKSYKSLKAPAGFIHAYDLTRILLAASQSAKLTGDAKQDKKIIRQKIENLNIEVRGLIKSYYKPFSKYSKSNPDGHEALSKKFYVMMKFDKNGLLYK